jgi:hypothetical protein
VSTPPGDSDLARVPSDVDDVPPPALRNCGRVHLILGNAPVNCRYSSETSPAEFAAAKCAEIPQRQNTACWCGMASEAFQPRSEEQIGARHHIRCSDLRSACHHSVWRIENPIRICRMIESAKLAR